MNTHASKTSGISFGKMMVLAQRRHAQRTAKLEPIYRVSKERHALALRSFETAMPEPRVEVLELLS